MSSTNKQIANIYYDLFEFMTTYNHRLWSNVKLPLPLNYLGILYILEQHPQVTLSQLVDKLAISKQQLSVILEKLKKQEYISKVTSAEDRRCSLISLTNKGRELILKHRHKMRENFINHTHDVDNCNPKEFAKSVETIKEIVKSLFPDTKTK